MPWDANAIYDKLDEILRYPLENQEFEISFIRKRVFTFSVCILSFLLNGSVGFSLGSSHLLSKMFASGIWGNLKKVPGKKSYAAACDKIKPEMVERLLEKSYALESKTHEELFHGLKVTIVDGTHVTLPRTTKTIEKYGLASGSEGECHYPQTQSVGFYNLSTGLFENFTSKHIKTPERKFTLEHAEKNTFPTLYVLDAGYNGMAHIGIMKYTYGQDILMQLKMGTAFAKDFMSSKRRSQIFEMKLSKVHLKNYPEFKHLEGKTIKVRLIRTRGTSKLRSQLLITTLLDQKLFAWEELALLYMQRYKVELAFRHLKSQIGIERIQKQKLLRIEQLLQAGALLFNMSVMLRNTVKRNSLLPEKAGVKVYCLELATTLVSILAQVCFKGESQMSEMAVRCLRALKSCFSINRPWRVTARICQFPASTFTRQKLSSKNSERSKVQFLKPEYELLGKEYGLI